MADAFISLCTLVGLIVIILFVATLIFFFLDTIVEKVTGKSILEREAERMDKEDKNGRF